MWPLSIVFLFALSAPQQTGPAVGQDFRTGKLPSIKIEPVKKDRVALPAVNANTCYAIRSYVFHRNDGQAPKLVNTTTCTPANTLRTLQTSPAPVQFVPAK